VSAVSPCWAIGYRLTQYDVLAAKNVALSGVRRLTLHDTKATSMLDLATQFYLSEQSIGKNRADESVAQVDQLNPYVSVDSSSVSLDDLTILKEYNVCSNTPPTHD
jgi:molybdopterin/thiamine biosynthesis adenylyltransferase